MVRYTRGETMITRSRNPKVEATMPALIRVRPDAPSSAVMVSAAGAVLRASPSTPSARR